MAHHSGTWTFDARMLAPHTAAWVAMIAAMMLQTTTPAARYVAFASRRARRQRSVLLFAAAYLTVWTAVGLAAVVVAAWDPPWWVGIGVLVLAGSYEFTPVKRRAVRRCHRTRPIRFRGWAADRSCLEFGAVHARSCVQACGPAMTALMLLGHPWLLFVVVGGAVTGQRVLRGGERWCAGTGSAVLLLGLCWAAWLVASGAR